jgi:hypothetical protein
MLVLDTTAFSAAMRLEPKLLSFLEQHRPGDISTVPPVIAAITMAHDAELVTANLAHFKRVEGLSSKHWEA